MWICPQCGELMEDPFDSCWRCGGERTELPEGHKPASEAQAGIPPKTQPAALRFPPIPPKPTARGLADDDVPRSIRVAIFEHHQRGGLMDSETLLDNLRIETFDSTFKREELVPSNWPSLMATFIYRAESNDLTVMILESERLLPYLRSPSPGDIRTTFRLSPEKTDLRQNFLAAAIETRMTRESASWLLK